jgi:uncharacterized BrkB/YihY/UPF0761 family membrane protein
VHDRDVSEPPVESSRDDDPDGAEPEGGSPPSSRVQSAISFGRLQVDQGRSRAEQLFAPHRDRAVVDVALRIYERDKVAAGTVVSSAVAFRLFLFFVPMLLFVVGFVGIFGDVLTSEVVDEARIAGSLAGQIDSALDQRGSGRWLAALAGFFGMASTGRTLARALSQASCLAWRLPVSAKASLRTIGVIVGLFVGLGLAAAVTNRIDDQFGVGLAGISYLAAAAIYSAVWWLLSLRLPRSPSHRSALLPGALLVGTTLAVLQAASQLYLPGRFQRASELYGAIGVTLVVLGWFFITGRVIVLSMTINACVFERFGSISEFLFSLPVLRAVPRRWPWAAAALGLETDVADPPADEA